jgi:ABC-type uncharacterized transport system involved in gliding motility auxiliary subunit
MTKKHEIIITILSVTALALAIAVGNRLWFRLDLTAAHAYTIAPVSRNLYAEIPDQVRITYYASEKLKAIHPIPGEIEDVLREYATYSHGKIQVSVRDPVKDRMAQVVEEFGIAPQQIQTVEQDEATFATVYTGIVIEYLDRAEVMPVVFSLETLEYDLTSRIRSLVREQDREIGILVGDEGRQLQADYSFAVQALAQAGYAVRQIAPGGDITVPVLFVLGGAADMDEAALYPIDQYIHAGGKALFAVDRFAVDTQTGLEVQVLEDGGLLALLARYGVDIAPALVLDRAANTVQFQSVAQNGARQIRLIRYPLWIATLEENSNAAHPVTARFGGADLFWASPLTLNPPDGVTAVPLFSTTARAWLQTTEFWANPDVDYMLERELPDTTGQRILAAALSGVFPRFFTDDWLLEPEPRAPGTGQQSRIIVIGDSDIVSSYIQATQSRRNLDFMVQAADWLGNDDDIIGIRNRLSGTGRLDRIPEPGRRTPVMNTAKAVSIVVMPVLVLLAGILLAWRRKVSNMTG